MRKEILEDQASGKKNVLARRKKLSEKYGRPITMQSFIDFFKGKSNSEQSKLVKKLDKMNGKKLSPGALGGKLSSFQSQEQKSKALDKKLKDRTKKQAGLDNPKKRLSPGALGGKITPSKTTTTKKRGMSPGALGGKLPRGMSPGALGGKAKSSAKKTYKDYKTIAAAKKAGSLYYMGKDGKKKAAVTAEDLKKSGLSLRDYMNYKLGKTRKGK
tara:strand:+ start:1042 stop:1683 length:642 start_codon:yes stop_codon:yes gene_type:complete